MLEIKGNADDLFHLTQSCIQKLKEKYPNFSSSQIASVIGIEQSTFSRIENQETKTPSLNTMLKLLSGLDNKGSVADSMKAQFPPFINMVQNSMSHNSKNSIMSQELVKYFKMPIYRDIMLLASTSSGTTRSEVQKEFGDMGMRKLNELLKDKIVTESQDVIRVTAIKEGDRVTFDQDTIKELMVNCTKDHYDPDMFGLDDSWLTFQSESVDEEKALKHIIPIFKEAYNKVEKIFRSPDFKGKGKIFIGMVSGSLHKTKDCSKGGAK